jgi:hypothetical protein
MRAHLLVVACVLFGGCKSKKPCTDAPVTKAITHVDDATAAALGRAKESGRVCDEVEDKNGREPGAMVFSGSWPTAWKTVEDALLTADWERVKQDKPPQPDTMIFSVVYKKKGQKNGGPTLFLMIGWKDSCRFGDVCVTGHQD